MPMAGRAVFQMDQATFANQGLLRHIGKRSKNTNMDGNISLCSYRFGEKTHEFGYHSLHFSTDFECQCIRESRYISIGYEFR